MKRIMLVGHGRAGKDTAGEFLASITNLRFAGTTSLYLARYVAAEVGRPVEEVYATRHQNRDLWYRIGNEIRESDPGILVRESLANGEIIGGVRDLCEVVYARQHNVVDLVVWIENRWVPPDPTVKFTERECDIVIPNNWSLGDFHNRLLRFAAFAKLPPRPAAEVTKGRLLSATANQKEPHAS